MIMSEDWPRSNIEEWKMEHEGREIVELKELYYYLVYPVYKINYSLTSDLHHVASTYFPELFFSSLVSEQSHAGRSLAHLLSDKLLFRIILF